MVKSERIVPEDCVIVFYYHNYIIDPQSVTKFSEDIVEFEYKLLEPHVWEQQRSSKKEFFYHGQKLTDGTKIPPQIDITERGLIKVLCPTCKNYTPLNRNYCEYCGHDLRSDHKNSVD